MDAHSHLGRRDSFRGRPTLKLSRVTTTPRYAPSSSSSSSPFFLFFFSSLFLIHSALQCFQLRAKGNDANPLFVKVAANNRLVLKPTNPDSFYLVKTLKSNFFNLCNSFSLSLPLSNPHFYAISGCGSMYVALSSDNFIKLTKVSGAQSVSLSHTW